jgi:3-hydroxyisobutyrate dehydrogenase-like beta-hydroxyacid dehydrogenase
METAEISFLGLGNMGFALAESVIKAGHDTVVWNRTASKAEPLVKLGAAQASSAADAISRSPIIVVCVVDYDSSDSILKSPDCLPALEGKVLVQLSSGSCELARAAGAWATEAGAKYLDGGIECYPEDIGTPDSTFFLSGDEEGYAQAEPILRVMAPKQEYLGDDPGRASALDTAMLATDLGLILGVMSGAAICEATGIPISKYVESARPVIAPDIEAQYESAIKYESGDLLETDAFLKQWAEVVEPVIETLRSAGYSTEFPRLVRELMKRGIDQGWGEHDAGVLIKVLGQGNK